MTNPIKNPWEPLSKEVITITLLPEETTAVRVQTVAEDLVTTYGPQWLLKFDETGGIVAYDSSGNSNDFTYIDTYGQMVLGTPIQDGELFEDLHHGFKTSTSIHAERDSLATTAELYSVMAVYEPWSELGSEPFYDHGGTGNTTLLVNQGSPAGGWDKFTVEQGGDIYVSERNSAYNGIRLWAVVLNGATLDFYENGLKFYSSGVNGYPLSSGAFQTKYGYDGSEYTYGYNYLAMFIDGEASDEKQYEIFKTASSKTHYFYEVMGTLSEAQYFDPADFEIADFDTLKHPPASLVLHYPLWEEAGGQAIDVSGNENHGDYISGPSLAQDPMTPHAIYSVYFASGDYISTSLNLDPSVDDFTISMKIRTEVVEGGLFTVGESAGNYLMLWVRDSIAMVYIYDGTTLLALDGLVVNDNLLHSIVMRWNASTKIVSLWVDNVKSGDLNTSSVTLISGSLGQRIGSGYPVNANAFIGNIELPTIFNAALSDADCALL